MGEPVLGTNVVTQIGIIVRDIEKSARVFAEFLGADKPRVIVTDAPELAKTEYGNSHTPARAKLAFFYAGGLDIELIEPDENPSTWREFLDTNGEGVHHIAFVIKDMAGKIRKLADMGMPLIQRGEYTGGRYAYIESNDKLKVMLELLEND